MSGIDEDTKVSEDDLATLRRHAFGRRLPDQLVGTQVAACA
jgi:hypothetical protein